MSPSLSSPQGAVALLAGGFPPLPVQVNHKYFSRSRGGRLNYNEDGFEELLEDEFKGCVIGNEQVWS